MSAPAAAPPVTASLRLAEAVDLGHAWLQAVAASRGIRVLFIKGPALHRHALREPRVSADIDVLVEPARLDDLVSAVEEAGWHSRPETFFDQHRTLHSATLIADGWPCDLDLHGFYPGFLADPAEVFEALWARRIAMTFAHRECAVPDRIASALILALHSLRSTSSQGRHAAELERLVTVALSDEEKLDAAALARATGCAATLEAVLPRLGVHVQPTPAELASPALREWRVRVASGARGTYFWFAALRQAGWRERATIGWRAVWPSRRDLLVARPDTIDTVPGRVAARVRRWGRGLSALPSNLRAWAAYGGASARRRGDRRGGGG